MSGPRDRCTIRNFLARGGEKVDTKKSKIQLFNILVHKWNNCVCLSALSLFSNFSFLNSFTLFFFFIFHKNSPSVHESQVHLPTIPIVLAKKRHLPLWFRLPLSYFSSSLLFIRQSSYTLLVFYPRVVCDTFSSFPHLLNSLFIHLMNRPFNDPPSEINGCRNDFSYYLLSAYLFCYISLLFFILTELNPKLELGKDDLRLPICRQVNPERSRHSHLLAYSLRHDF